MRQLQGDLEVSTLIASTVVPSGFVWYGVPHTVGVTVGGNAMSVTLDGAAMLNVPDLVAASAAAAKTSYKPPTPLTVPTTGAMDFAPSAPASSASSR